ncbi:ftsJ-like methyltransferase [Hirsutella rhossiliensis]|uniref:rRNA methyltransferase 2, mitochondrial n=1 Tax=Hirsutella rhossiliensis TaxID=111463 RepID=A0A9P8N5Q5_9HYPO|nr:ftsJ-like methyltransferase domain-containing protein [Hirsutella rhossiliensis]KAH0967457.1 ftsJ-like methyltransferase domain-containing protein [Hirsutella rhossiliensis]
MFVARLALGRPPPSLAPPCRCAAAAAAQLSRPGVRPASSSSSSSSRWKQRQGRDKYARDAKVHALKSRAAFKLLEMDAKYRLFKPNQTVVDLGYAPGSWSQVAVERTRPHGHVVGIDLIPAQPPRGVATFQGDFLSPMVQRLVKDFILRMRRDAGPEPPNNDGGGGGEEEQRLAASAVDRPSYIDRERHLGETTSDMEAEEASSPADAALVDLVLSDMLMNTSGNAFRDHAGSMDLCAAALQFASDTLKPGGHFVCKFYQGAEDKALEQRLRKLFAKVHREKPESSRSESKEAYFIALRRKQGVLLEGEA